MLDPNHNLTIDRTARVMGTVDIRVSISIIVIIPTSG
jgi:hypothetical protein